MTDSELIERYRQMRAMGLPRPPEAREDLWNQAGPYDYSSAAQAIAAQLEQQIIAKAQAPLPADGKQAMTSLVPLATKVHAEAMLDPGVKMSDRLQASRTVYEYALGKPTQTIEHTGSLAIEVHNKLEKLVRDMKSGSVIESQNLLAKPKSPVDNFLEKHMPEKFVVGRREKPLEQEPQDKKPREGLPE